ncbi:MAG: shikimate kinase [Bacteroidota bacterium]
MHKHKHRLIYLTGFMASGKSTIGPILANCLGFNHIDLDAELVKISGKTIRAYFIENGETAFRELEFKKLKEISAWDGYVVSLGGGTILWGENIQLIKSTGFLIYLKSNPQQLFRRLRHKNDRPTLQTASGESLSDEELLSRIETLLDKRESCYAQADLVVPTDLKPVGRTVDQIVKMLKNVL